MKFVFLLILVGSVVSKTTQFPPTTTPDPLTAFDEENPFIDFLEDSQLLNTRAANRLRTPGHRQRRANETDEERRRRRHEAQATFILIFAFANLVAALFKLFVWK